MEIGDFEDVDTFPTESHGEMTHTARYGEVFYDVYKLIHKAQELPTLTVPINLLSHHKDRKSWFDKNDKKTGPYEVLELAKKYDGNPDWDELIEENPHLEKFLKKTKNADLKYPILVVGEDYIIDGLNRLTKALIQGREEISIKRFDTLPEDAVYEGDFRPPENTKG